jgi:hypothetical protein
MSRVDRDLRKDPNIHRQVNTRTARGIAPNRLVHDLSDSEADGYPGNSKLYRPPNPGPTTIKRKQCSTEDQNQKKRKKQKGCAGDVNAVSSRNHRVICSMLEVQDPGSTSHFSFTAVQPGRSSNFVNICNFPNVTAPTRKGEPEKVVPDAPAFIGEAQAVSATEDPGSKDDGLVQGDDEVLWIGS